MTESYDARHVLRDLENSRPKSWSPGGIECYDTELWIDSGSTRSSSRDSFSSTSGNSLSRGMESPEDIREAFKQRKGRQRSPSPYPIHATYAVSKAPEAGGSTEAAASGVEELCENCTGISVEILGQPGGYKHSMLSEFSKSKDCCKLCEEMAFCLSISRIDGATKFIPDRYQIVLSLRETDDNIEIRPNSTNRQALWSPPTGHGKSDHFRSLWVELFDLRPSESPDDDMAHLNLIDLPFGEPLISLAPDGSKLRRIAGGTLFCYTVEHDPATEFGVQYVRQMGSDTSSTHSFEIAAGWLKSCLSAEDPPKLKTWWSRGADRNEVYRGHEAGGFEVVASNSEVASLAAQDPLRLVEIQPDARGKATSIRVIHTDGRRYPYAALSYCWGRARPGDDRPWQTKHATLNSHLQGINRRRLPQALQDAIYICEKLQIFYLWVDSLCIIQDSPSDWEEESAKMSGIYLGSLLTIGLSSCDSVEDGVFTQGSGGLVESENFQGNLWIAVEARLRDGRSSRLYITGAIPIPQTFTDEVRNGVLGQRAWTLQEYIMSRRTLYFTSKQLMWECRHCRLREDNFIQDQRELLYPICDYGFPLDAKATIEMWYKKVVVDYTRRQLTYEKDRLVAMSALARATYLNRHIDYVAGLWRDCIVPGLLWVRSSRGCKSKTYSCPTWSWASQNSAVNYFHATPSKREPIPSEFFPRVQNVSWKNASPKNPFGDVLYAYVDLETTISLGTVLRDKTFYDRRLWNSEYGSQTLMITGSGQSITPWFNATMDDGDRCGRNVVVANMGHCFLLLEPPSLSSEKYRRVGISITTYGYEEAKNRSHMDDLTRGWTQRTIRLV